MSVGNISLHFQTFIFPRLQDASRDLPAKLPEKLCASAPRAKAALNAKDSHTNVDLI